MVRAVRTMGRLVGNRFFKGRGKPIRRTKNNKEAAAQARFNIPFLTKQCIRVFYCDRADPCFCGHDSLGRELAPKSIDALDNGLFDLIVQLDICGDF